MPMGFEINPLEMPNTLHEMHLHKFNNYIIMVNTRYMEI